MQFVTGTILHTKVVKSRKGREIPVVSILDEYQQYSQVIDVTDFDGFVNGYGKGTVVHMPIRTRPGVSQKGNAYINYVAAGPAEKVT